ncbi:trissin receptor [Trichonephila inaurata madagascariensis]|uniref:Trissin receptor n=1 Tax=Trichonephila inaurata madagascariensis TaxID=2747483 RepID=A0A8X6YMR4_9ARAC|nr:trissin receptor [Trichonephila inaurata madagascariensis]
MYPHVEPIFLFSGNLLVMLVVIMHRRMRTITNFFLTNLAVADLCVGLFCVYQNLSFYLTSHWAFGEFLCKMYHFIHSLSYTASIAILTVISVERYVAIVHPMLSKQVSQTAIQFL